MTHYIIQTIAFQLFFLLIYDAFLKKETFFNWNRAYLLITTLLSISLPFIKVERFKTVVPQDFIIRLPEVVIGTITNPETAPSIAISQVVEPASFQWSWLYLLYAGMFIATVLLLYKSYKIHQLIQNNPKRWNGNLILVQVLQSSTAFSFFNYIFLGENIKPSEKTTILNHEMIHVKHKHSLDLVVFELLRIVFWFNPLIYMYQNRIASLHEFIADAEAVKQNDKTEYYQNLLSQAFDTENVSFINPFFKQSLIKKRILMLSKSKSKQVHLLKYALLIPMVFGMLLYTSCEQQITQEELSTEINLEDLTYSMKLGEEENDEIKNHKEIQTKFLKGNLDTHASIMDFDFEKKEIVFKVELINNISEEYRELTNFIDSNNPYRTFINIIPNKNLKMEINEESIEVPFSVIENAPTHSSCKDLETNDERKDCIRDFITTYVSENYNTNIAKENGLTGQQRINVIFKIDIEGNVVEVQSRAPHPALETEAKRVINSLPKFIPGTQKGKAVVVPYSLPILFNVNSDKQTETDKTLKEMNELASLHKNAIPFSTIDVVPTIEDCVPPTNTKSQKKCVSNYIETYVNKNFDKNIAKKLGLKGEIMAHLYFLIDDLGIVREVSANSSHPELEAEAIRVVNTLPVFVPGKHKGKVTVVAYASRIYIKVD